jgi:hypothetical protein
MCSNNLQIGFTPVLNRQVEYFQEIELPVTIANKRSTPVVVESLTLQFHSDKGEVDYYRKFDVGHEIQPHGLLARSIPVRPNLQFLPTTNSVRIMVKYRQATNGVLGPLQHEKSDRTYIIVNPCPIELGQLFISFKQPEDRRLARLLQRLAERAGFKVFLQMDNPIPGRDPWETIEARLIDSIAVAFIWTDHTAWGSGVEREIKLSKDNGKYYVPLIEKGLSVPDFFQNSGIEYVFFETEDPLQCFAQAIEALRESIINGEHVAGTR